MIKKIITVFVALCLPAMVVAAALPAPAHALFEDSISQACQGASLSDGENECNDTNGSNRIDDVITIVINILTVIVGIAAVIIIIINGFRFVTANGDSGAVTNARNGIIYALVGLVVVALAQAIVRFVISKL